MKKLIQQLFIQLILFFVIIIVIEYLLKFGVKEFNFSKLMEILPGIAIDFAIIALVFFVYYLIKFKRRKRE